MCCQNHHLDTTITLNQCSPLSPNAQQLQRSTAQLIAKILSQSPPVPALSPSPSNNPHYYHHYPDYHHNYHHICSQVIPAPWVKGQHCGVCGNFDGNTKNEMQDKVNIFFIFYFSILMMPQTPKPPDSIEIFDRPTFDLLPDWSHGACRHALKGLVPTVVPSRK